MLKWIIVLFFSGICMSQELPNAPSVTQPPAAAVTCGRYHWSCWGNPPATISNSRVLKSKAFWVTWLSDIAVSSLDAEISHEGLAHGHHGCREAFGNNSRWQLYRANLPENAAVGVVTFIWLKVKGPKYVLPAFLARPSYVHLEATADWLHQCY